MPLLWSLLYADSTWGWGSFPKLETENSEGIKKDDITKYKKVLCFVNDRITLLGEERLPEGADPGFLARKDKRALSLVLAKTWAAFLPCLQRRKRQRPKQRQQRSSALDPWQSWCLHGSDGKRNTYTGHQVDWLLGRNKEEFLVKCFDRHCWTAAQKPLFLLLCFILACSSYTGCKGKIMMSPASLAARNGHVTLFWLLGYEWKAVGEC